MRVARAERAAAGIGARSAEAELTFLITEAFVTLAASERYVAIARAGHELADAQSDLVLGVHIVSSLASEMIGEAAMTLEFSASSEDIASICHAHPTLYEPIREAAPAVDKRTLNI